MYQTKSKSMAMTKGKKTKAKSKVKNRMDEVYTKAAALFREYGYQKTTMNDIARELNIQKGSLYYYVSDKETLLYEILKKTLDLLLEGVKRLEFEGLSPVEKLNLIINEQFKNVASYKVEMTLLVNEMRNLQPEQRKELVDKRKQYESFFLDVIREGLSDGTFIEHNQHIVAFFILGGVYWFHHWFSVEEIEDSKVMKKDFVRLILNGLAVERVTDL